jgi:hypothetical protein
MIAFVAARSPGDRFVSPGGSAEDETGAPQLVYRDGVGRRLVLSLSGFAGRITIGRAPESDVHLAWDGQSSRRHAVLERSADGWTAVDGASRNGTFVNGERLRGRRALTDGDALRVGGTTLVFRAGDAARKKAPPIATPDAGARAPRRGRILLATAAALVAVLLAAQAFLPGIAARQVRSALGPGAAGVEVDIAATPAVKLLWHRADRVRVSVDRLSPSGSGGGSLGDMLSGLRVARRIDIRVGELRARGLVIRDAVLRKRADLVYGRADVDVGALEAVLPSGLRVRPLAAPAHAVRLRGRLSAFGRRVEGGAILRAEGGRIVVRAEGVPLASLLAIPLFADDRIAVDDLSARPSRRGIAFTARAHLRDG